MNHKSISPNRGDFITEIQLMKALSGIADVYYSGNKITDNEFGKEYKGNVLAKSREQKYDFYYVRNNPKLFKKLPNKKIFFVSPYYRKVFAQADGIASLTDEWTRRLRGGVTTHGYPDNYQNDRVWTFHQTVDDRFRPLRLHKRTRKIRKDIGGDFIIGHFGALRRSCYPYSFLKVLPEIQKAHPGVKAVFSTKKASNTNNISDKSIIEKSFGYNDMPYAISACDLILYNFRGTDGHFVGSMKILEAMACGTPVLSPRFKAREEELGEEYEMFHDFKENGGRFGPKIEKQIKNKIIGLIEDIPKRVKISNYLLKRVKFYQMKESRKRLKKILEEIASSK